jgi:hypothetical protein
MPLIAIPRRSGAEISALRRPRKRSTLMWDGAGAGSAVVVVADYAAIADLFASGCTMQGWAVAYSAGVNNIGRFFEKGTAGTNFSFRFASPSGAFAKLVFGAPFDGGTAGLWTTTSTVVELGKMFMWAVTYDGSDVNNDPIIYINGLPVAITENTKPVGTIRGETGNLLYGNSTGLNRAHDGTLDEMSIWSAVRSAGEIMEDYTTRRAYVGNETNLASYIPGTRGGGSSAVNLVSGGNVGGITGAVWVRRTGGPVNLR